MSLKTFTAETQRAQRGRRGNPFNSLRSRCVLYVSAVSTFVFGHIMRKFIYAASGLLLLFLVPAGAQQPVNGTFQTYIGDRLVMTESYRATFKPDGSIATEGETTPAAGGAKQKIVTLGSKTKPDSFAFEVGGVKTLEGKLRMAARSN